MLKEIEVQIDVRGKNVNVSDILKSKGSETMEEQERDG
jgi:hypothetical protein